MNITGKNLKTLQANVQLEMVDDVLEFHNKGNIIVDENFFSRLAPHTLTTEQFSTLERSDSEIIPFHAQNIDCSTSEKITPQRLRSAIKFSDEKIPFETVKALLQNSFVMNQEKGRPYASGGALYPVEIICALFEEKISDGPASGFYHYRPALNVLQPIKNLDSKKITDVFFRIEQASTSRPNFVLLYVGGVGKTLVKYRYRGYRYALMEAGAMFHQADLISQNLGLVNKLYSGFNDHEVMKLIGLDRMSFLPFVMQSFGVAYVHD